MQAVILAAGRGVRLNRLTASDTKCMVKINGIPLIERMLKALDRHALSRIILVDGYQKEHLETFVRSLPLKTPVQFIENPDYQKTNNLYSLYLAKEALLPEDTLVLDSDIIFDPEILTKLVRMETDAAAVIDRYKSWMTGQSLLLNDRGEITDFQEENQINHLNILNSYKTIGMYRFSASFLKHNYLPFLEAYLQSDDEDAIYAQMLDVLSSPLKARVKPCFVGDYSWYEINDIQDVDLASTLFSEDEELVTNAMLGRWGGYWRYPDYLDYFYLVTPYYPTTPLLEELKAHFDELLIQYPSGMRVNALLAAKEFMVEPENIIVGNGASELIKSLMSRIQGPTGFVKPTFEEYPNRLTQEEHIDFRVETENFTYTSEDLIRFFQDKNLKNLVLVNPDNPSGNYIDKASMKVLLDWTRDRHIRLIIDESFVDFADEPDPTLIRQEILDQYPDLYVIKSISKSYGVPGLRLGVLASGGRDTIAWMKKDVSIWNINSFAEFYMQIAGKYRKDYEHALDLFREERRLFEAALAKVPGIRVIPSQANYVMVELTGSLPTEQVKKRMLIDEKIFIKTLDKKIPNGRQYLRLAVRNHEDNEKLIAALNHVLKNTSN